MPMSDKKRVLQRRVLVTGSRGKSSIARLLYAGMQAAGLQTFARLTGVVPRELGPGGERAISRSAGAHVEEMRWWLNHLPASAQAIVLENSAITAEFQPLACRWLRPDVTVLANTLPDHQELWGPTSASAADVLTAGIPKQGQVILPAGLRSDDYLIKLLERRHCQLFYAEPATGLDEGYLAVNMGLALTTLIHMGFEKDTVSTAMRQLQPDRYDFHVASCAGADVALAFAANDVASTRVLFDSLNWSPNETSLIYNHRADRPGRLKSFKEWLSQSHWRDVMIIGDKPRQEFASARYLNIRNVEGLLKLFQPGDRVFGCGNIAGLPLSLTAVLDR